MTGSEPNRGLFKRYRKRGAIAVAIIVAIELIAAAAIVIGGRELVRGDRASASSNGGTPGPAFQLPRSSMSIAVF